MSRPYNDDTALTTHAVLRRDVPWETCALILPRMLSDTDAAHGL